MGWYIGKEEESLWKEMKVFGLLPGRKIFFWALDEKRTEEGMKKIEIK